VVQLIVEVRDKDKIEELGQYGVIVYTSKYLNVVGMEAPPEAIRHLANHPNVVSVEMSREGEFQYI